VSTPEAAVGFDALLVLRTLKWYSFLAISPSINYLLWCTRPARPHPRLPPPGGGAWDHHRPGRRPNSMGGPNVVDAQVGHERPRPRGTCQRPGRPARCIRQWRKSTFGDVLPAQRTGIVPTHIVELQGDRPLLRRHRPVKQPIVGHPVHPAWSCGERRGEIAAAAKAYPGLLWSANGARWRGISCWLA